MAKHECTRKDLEWADIRDLVDNGEGLYWPVTCGACGRKFERIYFPENSFWDPEAKRHVYLPD